MAVWPTKQVLFDLKSGEEHVWWPCKGGQEPLVGTDGDCLLFGYRLRLTRDEVDQLLCWIHSWLNCGRMDPEKARDKGPAADVPCETQE